MTPEYHMENGGTDARRRCMCCRATLADWLHIWVHNGIFARLIHFVGGCDSCHSSGLHMGFTAFAYKLNKRC